MARRWVVAIDGYAREATSAKVSYGGVVKSITSAVCVENGICRQYWPPAGGLAQPRIRWTTTALTVSESVADPLDAAATILFTRDTGIYTYDNFPNADVNSSFLNPPLSGLVADDGKYLIRIDQVSGTALTATLATWIDLNAASSVFVTLDNLSTGTLTAVANISIAEDDGAGSPASGTTVVKQVTFNSTVTGAVPDPNYITWGTTQRDLVEIKEAVDADCILTFNPAGFAVGDADTSGSFNEEWHTGSPIVGDPENFTVQVDLISGTVPSAATVNVNNGLDNVINGTDNVVDVGLGVPLTLDAVREWTLTATSSENLSCALDVTVDDLVPVGNAATRRITMNSQRTQAVSTNVWSSTPEWVLNDLWDSGVGPAGCYIDMQTDGTVVGSANNLIINYSEDWVSDAPTPADPENYEGRINLIEGTTTGVTGVLDTWFTLPNLSWAFESTTVGLTRWVVDVLIRRIGGIAVTKRVTIIVVVE